MKKIFLATVMAASSTALLVPSAAAAASETAPAAALTPAVACPQGKQMWPELVAVHANIAKLVIEKENPSVRTVVILAGSPVTADYRCDRVRVFVNAQNQVVETPRVG